MSEIFRVRANAKESDIYSEGWLILWKLSDVVYTLQFKNDKNKVTVDIDDVTFDDQHSTCFFDDQQSVTLRIQVCEKFEYKLVKDCIDECNTICSLILSLNGIVRDVFFQGLYQKLVRGPSVSIGDVIEEHLHTSKKRSHEKSRPSFVECISLDDTKSDDGCLSAGSNTGFTIDEVRIEISQIQCIFCSFTKLTSPERTFFLHPYVPRSNSKAILFCDICIGNWKDFRNQAIAENMLILPGEVNEELCCVCSDTPELLTMCEKCPRSFCRSCLENILTRDEIQSLENTEVEWICMSCSSGDSPRPDLTKAAWVRVSSMLPRKQCKSRFSSVDVDPFKSGSNNKVDNLRELESTIGEGLVGVGGTIRDEEKSLKLTIHLPRKSQSSKSSSSISSSSCSNSSSRKSGILLSGTDANATSAASSSIILNGTIPKHPPQLHRNGEGRLNESEDSETKSTVATSSSATLTELPPVNQQQDEVFYFAQYLSYYSGVCSEVAVGARKSYSQGATDDSCFLCKDGGELVECEWENKMVAKSQKSKHKTTVCCMKVYHEYCLGYTVGERRWTCPRHFCDVCAVLEIKYICMYCPISLCENCPAEMVKKYGMKNYRVVADPPSGEFPQDSEVIICHNCLDMINRAQRRGELPTGFTLPKGTDHHFPGTAGKDCRGRPGIFKTFNQELVPTKGGNFGGGSSKENVIDFCDVDCVVVEATKKGMAHVDASSCARDRASRANRRSSLEAMQPVVGRLRNSASLRSSSSMSSLQSSGAISTASALAVLCEVAGVDSGLGWGLGSPLSSGLMRVNGEVADAFRLSGDPLKAESSMTRTAISREDFASTRVDSGDDRLTVAEHHGYQGSTSLSEKSEYVENEVIASVNSQRDEVHSTDTDEPSSLLRENNSEIFSSDEDEVKNGDAHIVRSASTPALQSFKQMAGSRNTPPKQLSPSILVPLSDCTGDLSKLVFVDTVQMSELLMNAPSETVEPSLAEPTKIPSQYEIEQSRKKIRMNSPI